MSSFGNARRNDIELARAPSQSDRLPPTMEWWLVLNEKVLHPHFLLLLQCGGLPKPGQAYMRPIFKLYYRCLCFFFASCLIICASRLVWHSRPAYYNIWTNLAFVLLHLWIPFAHHAVTNLLMFHAVMDADGNVDPEVEDVEKRSSLQQSLSELVTGFSEAKRSLAEAEWDNSSAAAAAATTATTTTGAGVAASELAIRRREVQSFEDEFTRIRKATGLIAHVGAAFGLVAVVLVVFGWVWFDFFADAYHDESAAAEGEYKRSALERLWFGYMSGGAFAIIVVPWVAALMAVYGMIRTLVYVAKARVRIFTAACERAFDKAVAMLGTVEHEGGGGDDCSRSGRNSSSSSSSSSSDSGGGGGGGVSGGGGGGGEVSTITPSPLFKADLQEQATTADGRESQKLSVRRKFNELQRSAAAGGLLDELAHHDLGFTEYHCDAATLRGEIQAACAEWDVLLSALIMVCLALIIMPIINFTASNGGGSGANDDNDGMSTLQGTDAHYYLRDIFNLTVGLFACFLALSETASLTNECNRCIEVVFDLHKDTPWVPPIKGHLVLRDYVCSPQYASKFGFTIFGTKIENKHIATFGYVVACIFSAVGGQMASNGSPAE